MLVLQNYLREYNKTITTAESCTGGLIASMITEVSGSSDIFDGSIVSYSNSIKKQELNVSENNLKDYGAVSIEVVREMLQGSLKKFNADFSIAVSGIAGPNGGTKQKPVGTVVIGIAGTELGSIVDVYGFEGTREEVQLLTAKTSLKEIYKFVLKTLDK
jgi:nicotinamide-nucleotide amidase